jgi:hypothetical protein
MRTLVITEAPLKKLRLIGQRPYKATAHSFRKVFSRASVLVPTLRELRLIFFYCPPVSFYTFCLFSFSKVEIYDAITGGNKQFIADVMLTKVRTSARAETTTSAQD